MLFLACSHILCRNVNNAVRINIKCNFNLWNATRSGWNTNKVKVSKSLVFRSHFAFTLQYVNCNGSLTISSCRENLALLCRNCSISWNEFCHNAAHCFNTKRKRCYIEKKNILYIACKNTTLNSSTHRYGFVRVNSLQWFFSEEVLYNFLEFWHTRRTTNQKNFINLIFCISRIFKSVLTRNQNSVPKALCHSFKFCTCQSFLKVLWTCSIRSNERQVNVCRCLVRKSDFCLFRSVLNTLHSHWIFCKVDSCISLK